MDHVYYINLEHRVDRKDNIEGQMSILGISTTRIEAVYNKVGAIGCGLSHIKALRLALENNKPYSIILEDDFFLFNYEAYGDFSKAFNKIKTSEQWDVIVMTPRGDTIDSSGDMAINGFKKIHNNQTATGYIIKKAMIPILIENLKAAVAGLIKNLDPNVYAIDQYWKSLQDKYGFYYYRDMFAGQLPGYSDIEKRQVDYNARFLDQHRY
jgi:GR25 family glycosyltransferase involved in LPS biosynthesis